MLLAIDVGNSHTVLGLYENTVLCHDFRISSDRSRTSDEYAVLLSQLLHQKNLKKDDVTCGIIASVVPPLTGVFTRLCEQTFDIKPLSVGPGLKTGMAIRYDNPKEVGADRIVNGVAGYERYKNEANGPHPVVIVDFGTATTFDVVSRQGEYLGGAIAPGIAISMEALFRAASKLPRVDIEAPTKVIGKTTVESMQSGTFFGYVALVDGMLERIAKELGDEAKMLATGGMAHLISRHSTYLNDVDHLLTLEGLRLIYERNPKQHEEPRS